MQLSARGSACSRASAVWDFLKLFPQNGEFLSNILHAYYVSISYLRQTAKFHPIISKLYKVMLYYVA